MTKDAYTCNELDKAIEQAKKNQTTNKLPDTIIDTLLFDNKNEIKLYYNHNILEILANKMLYANNDDDRKIYQTAYEGVLAHYDNQIINEFRIGITNTNNSDNGFRASDEFRKPSDKSTKEAQITETDDTRGDESKDIIRNATLTIRLLASKALEMPFYGLSLFAQYARINLTAGAKLIEKSRHGAGPLLSNKTKAGIANIFGNSSKIYDANYLNNGVDMSANTMFEQALINNATKNINTIAATNALISIEGFNSTSIPSDQDQFKEMQKHFFPHNEYLNSIYVLKNDENPQKTPLVFAIDRYNRIITPDSTLLALQTSYHDTSFDIKTQNIADNSNKTDLLGWDKVIGDESVFLKWNKTNFSQTEKEAEGNQKREIADHPDHFDIWQILENSIYKTFTPLVNLRHISDSVTLNQRLTDLTMHSQSSNANYTNITAILKDMPVPGSTQNFKEAYPAIYAKFKEKMKDILSSNISEQDMRAEIETKAANFFNNEKISTAIPDKIINGFQAKLASLPEQMIKDDIKRISDIKFYDDKFPGHGKSILAVKRFTGQGLAMIAAVPELVLNFLAFGCGKVENRIYKEGSWINKNWSSALRRKQEQTSSRH